MGPEDANGDAEWAGPNEHCFWPVCGWAAEASSGMELLKVPPAARVPVAAPVLAARGAVNINSC